MATVAINLDYFGGKSSELGKLGEFSGNCVQTGDKL